MVGRFLEWCQRFYLEKFMAFIEMAVGSCFYMDVKAFYSIEVRVFLLET